MEDAYVVYRVAFDRLARVAAARLGAREGLGAGYAGALEGCRGIEDVFELATYPTPERERAARVVEGVLAERGVGLRHYLAYRALMRARKANGNEDEERRVLARVVEAAAFEAACGATGVTATGAEAAPVYTLYEEALGRAPITRRRSFRPRVGMARLVALVGSAAWSVWRGDRFVECARRLLSR